MPLTVSKKRLMRWALSLALCAWILSGCAAPRAPEVVECPPPVKIPETLVSDKSKTVNAFLSKVRSYLAKAAQWSEGSAQTETQSGRR
nr:MAG TPA: Prokaryotic membrane lipoprotein lipid attachment site [Caudoviricetes sp.]